VVKQKGMVFGFRKTATAVVGPEIEEEFFVRAQLANKLRSTALYIFERAIELCSV
jgi:hypothetical protein